MAQDMTPTSPTSTGAELPKRRRLLLLTGAAVLLAAAALWFFTTRVVSDGTVYRREAALDLRGQALTVAQYEELSRKLPECDIRWDIPIGDGRYDSAAKSVSVGDFSTEEVPLFSLFDRLERVTCAGEGSYDALLALGDTLPDCEVRWQVTLGGKKYPQSAVVLEPDGADYDELLEKLAYLPALRQLRTQDESLTPAQQAALMEKYPDVVFLWPVTLCGETLSSGARQLSFAGRADLTEASLDEIRDNAFRFPRLERLELTDCGFDNDALLALQNALPGVSVVWSFDLCGVTVRSTDREIDLSRQKIPDVSVVEDALPYFSQLEKVVMCDCGPSDAVMDALDRRHPDVRFVWMVHFAYFKLRTDATSFIAAKYTPCTIMYNSDTAPLWYCTDLVGLDLGHMAFSDISFLYAMPHLKYLILADCERLSDITPIASLKELTYLELFQNPIMDISPLLECTALQDLNICYIWGRGDVTYPLLLQMPWLERLWYCGNHMTEEQLTTLQAAMPDCEMFMGAHDESTGGTWRQHPHYFEMRDFFGMYYMKGGTNGVDEDGNQIYS